MGWQLGKMRIELCVLRYERRKASRGEREAGYSGQIVCVCGTDTETRSGAAKRHGWTSGRAAVGSLWNEHRTLRGARDPLLVEADRGDRPAGARAVATADRRKRGNRPNSDIDCIDGETTKGRRELSPARQDALATHN